jgi:hypothetical protein
MMKKNLTTLVMPKDDELLQGSAFAESKVGHWG